VVISSILRLEPGDLTAIRENMQHNLAYRKNTQPLQFASCGSVFRNPEHAFAGELIEACGLKGKKLGEAEISEQHANWIVNRNKKATSSDVLGLIRLAQAAVLERFGISLEPEVQLW
jgi:UDP-N-acetylmuramate dehydrogenase